jgi:hypothetical protein
MLMIFFSATRNSVTPIVSNTSPYHAILMTPMHVWENVPFHGTAVLSSTFITDHRQNCIHFVFEFEWSIESVAKRFGKLLYLLVLPKQCEESKAAWLSLTLFLPLLCSTFIQLETASVIWNIIHKLCHQVPLQISIQTHTHTHTHMYMYVCIYVCMFVYIYIYTHTHIHTHTHTCI